MRRRLALLLTVLVTAAGTAGLTAGAPSATAEPITFPELIDEEELCVELTPHVASYETKRVRLDMRVLLDRGAPKAIAQRAVTQMKQAYKPLGITVKPSYQKVRLQGASAPGLNEQAKQVFGGERPKGIDVVYTLTTADIGAGPPHYKNVAGLADCIGGVRFPDRAFAVGEIFPEESTGSTLPLPIIGGTGLTMAHEIGHVMGAHHHYASAATSFGGSGFATLMGPTLSIIKLEFSPVNAAMVRGHAQAYAD